MFDHVTPDQRQNAERYYTDLEYRAERDAKFAAQNNFDDQRWQNTDDGSTPEQPRQVVKYHEKIPFNPVTFILAVVIVVIAVVLSCPALMLVFRL